MTKQPLAPSPAIDPARSAKEISAVYIALVTMLALSGLDQSIVATALPRIGADFGGMAYLSWVVTAYTLASTAVMPLYGKLSDQYGRKPLLYFAIITFLLGSILCGLAQDMPQLVAFRVLQGIGAGGFLPLAQIVIGDLVAPEERGRRQGSIVAIYATTTVVGPVLGGVLTDLLSWHWIFFINMPVGALALFLIARAMPVYGRHERRRIDYLGSALLTGSVTAALLVLALGGSEWAWDGPQVTSLSLAAAAMLALLLVHVRRVPEPVLPLELFQSRVFVIGSLVLALAFVGMMGASVFFPILFQMVMGVSPANSGLLTVPLMIGMVLSSTVNGRLMAKGRFDYKRMQVVGLGLATAAFACLAWGIGQAAGLGVIEPAIFVLGAGLGLVSPNMTILVQQALPAARRGVGTAMLSFFRSLGGLVGVAGSGAILAQHLHGRVHAPALYRLAIAHIFTTGTAMLGLALAVLLVLPRAERA
jgi:EmrB/QacA subfamily drug resistance transporter